MVPPSSEVAKMAEWLRGYASDNMPVSMSADSARLLADNLEELRLLRELGSAVLEHYRERAGAWERSRKRGLISGPPGEVTITATFAVETLAALDRHREGK